MSSTTRNWCSSLRTARATDRVGGIDCHIASLGRFHSSRRRHSQTARRHRSVHQRLGRPRPVGGGISPPHAGHVIRHRLSSKKKRVLYPYSNKARGQGLQRWGLCSRGLGAPLPGRRGGAGAVASSGGLRLFLTRGPGVIPAASATARRCGGTCLRASVVRSCADRVRNSSSPPPGRGESDRRSWVPSGVLARGGVRYRAARQGQVRMSPSSRACSTTSIALEASLARR